MQLSLSKLATYERVGSINEYAADGARGTLTLHQSGSIVSLSYSGDRATSGTMSFVATTNTTARATEPSTIDATWCDVPSMTSAASSTAPLAIAAGALLVVARRCS